MQGDGCIGGGGRVSISMILGRSNTTTVVNLGRRAKMLTLMKVDEVEEG